jgi:hypothetical protein
MVARYGLKTTKMEKEGLFYFSLPLKKAMAQGSNNEK